MCLIISQEFLDLDNDLHSHGTCACWTGSRQSLERKSPEITQSLNIQSEFTIKRWKTDKKKVQSLQFLLPGCTKGQLENHLVWGSGVRSSSTLLCNLIWSVIIWNNFISLKGIRSLKNVLSLNKKRERKFRTYLILTLWYFVATLILCRYFGTWCWYFSGCRYKGLVSISGNHLIPDARHCHHFEVRYVRPGGNNISYENNSDGLLHAQYLPFHEEFNIECDEGPLKVQLNHMSDHNSDLYLKKKNIQILSHEMIKVTNLQGGSGLFHRNMEIGVVSG